MRKNDLGGTFDTVASAYEKFRPGYVEELYRTVFEYINIDSDSKAVEVGIGGGQATLPFLKTGCSLTAVDYGEYVTLIGTYSDHIAIEEKIRLEFFYEIENAIKRHDGEITIFDTIDLQLARKL